MLCKVACRTIRIESRVVFEWVSLKVLLESGHNAWMLRKVALIDALWQLIFILSVYKLEIELRIEHVLDIGFSYPSEVGERKDAALLQQVLLVHVVNRRLILLLIVDQ